MVGSVPDHFSRTTVLLRLARVAAGLGDPGTSWALLRRADREADALGSDRRARALALLAVVADDLGYAEWAATRQRQADAALDGLAEAAIRSRVHARLAEVLAEAGHVTAAEHHLRLVVGDGRPGAGHVRRRGRRFRRPPAVSCWPRPPRSFRRSSAPRTGRRPWPGWRRTAAMLARRADVPAEPAWTVHPVAELLAGDAWSLAAPALAHLEPDAVRVLGSWVAVQLTTPQ